MDRVYLDVCCLNRPFDDQSQDRIRLEAEAVLAILKRLRAGEGHWLGSDVVLREVGQTPDPERRERVMLIAGDAHSRLAVGEAEGARARELQLLGFRAFDALHIACAESGRADVLLTTDDGLLRRASRHKGVLRVRVVNPLLWAREVGQT
ncbi:MAG: type II toxin-antitoxin system VapC family toxin [Planctomycetes bacterium]|nr:type II toxin-antitoxin system VapC family toxin [Planctomycetota bacterium]